ncbi:hypothetical protein C8T65DRAFT_834440, partial [Cerioporus squamosus]
MAVPKPPSACQTRANPSLAGQLGNLQRIGGITGPAAFKATAQLRAMQHDETVPGTFAHDGESFAYVLLHSLYKHALEDPQATGAVALFEEFREFFPAKDSDVDDSVLCRRGRKYSVDGDVAMQHLLACLDGDAALGLCAGVTFNFLANVNKQNDAEALTNPAMRKAASF